LIPKEYIVDRFFSKESEMLDKINLELESVSSQIAEMEEEHSGEEGAFNELEKVNKANASSRLKEIAKDKNSKDESELLESYIALCEQQSNIKKKIKDLESKLDDLALKQYPKLKELDIKNLVVDDKWMFTLDTEIHGELDRVSRSLTNRIKELAERYESTLPELIKNVSIYESKVNKHLEKMGFVWN